MEENFDDSSCFNTQPPEGGWYCKRYVRIDASFCFNTQPPEGGWAVSLKFDTGNHRVSTHSRPKAAGCENF